MKLRDRIVWTMLGAVALLGTFVLMLPRPAAHVRTVGNGSAVATNFPPRASVQPTNAPAALPLQAYSRQEGRFDPLQLMKDSLDLTDDQAKRLEPVLADQRARIAALRRETTLSRRERVAKVNDMQRTFDSQLKSVLTPEQAEKWQKMRLMRLNQQ